MAITPAACGWALTLTAVSRAVRLLLFALGMGMATVAAYLLGRAMCPPPVWWLTLFTGDGNFGCVA